MANSIVQECRACSVSFEALCETLRADNMDYSSQMPLSILLDTYGRFNVWSGNIGAHQIGRVSLDHRLREAVHVKEQVIKLLRYLHENLDEGKKLCATEKICT